MKNFKPYLVLFCLLLLQTAVASESVYQDIYRELSSHANRLPGSAGYQASLRTLRAFAEKHDIEHGIQTFNTTVPETHECTFIVNGSPVEGVFPVQPNQFAPTTTSGRTLTGRLLYLGQGDKQDLRGLDIKGSIVLLDLNSEATRTLFNLGALAVIYVGHERASQWGMQYHGVEQPIHLPRAFISRTNAERQGLLKDTNGEASIRITSTWEHKVASNLWLRLPANKSDTELKDCLLFTATYDTFGFVPDYCPQKRDAANVALLAQLAVNLKQQERSRDVIITFLGSHFSAQEGARYVHWAGHNSSKDGETSSYFTDRMEQYQSQYDYYTELHDFLNDPEFVLKLSHKHYREARKQYRESLNYITGELLYTLGKVAVEAHEQKDEALTAKEEKLREEKVQWTSLLGDVMRADPSSGKGIAPERQEKHKRILKMTTDQIADVKKDIEQLMIHNKSNQAFAQAFGLNKTMMHVHFDFADDETPWLHNFTGDHSSLYTFLRIGLGFFKSHINQLNLVYDRANPEPPAAALFKYRHGTVKSESLCTPYKRSLACLTALTVNTFGYNLCTVGDALHKDNLPTDVDYDLKGLIPSLSKYMVELVNSPEIAIAYSGENFKIDDRLVFSSTGDKKRKGLRVSNFVKGGTDLAGSASYSLATVFYPNELPNYQPGHTNYVIGITDAKGFLLSPHMVKLQWQKSQAEGYGFDKYGAINRIGKVRINDNTHVKLFQCFGGGTLVPLYPLNYEKFTSSKFYLSENNLGVKAETSFTFEDSSSLGIYTDDEEKIKVINTAGIRMIGGTDTKPTGYGLDPDAQSLININPLRQTSEDLVRLNETRLKELRSKNIVLEDIETLHANAKDHLDQAVRHKSEKDHMRALSHSLYSATLANHAYTPLVNTNNDMIKAVVILLILSIPFAFSLERLFFGFTSIYKQVTGFLGFFLATFVLLYFAHPAFSLTSDPIIIFLAFVIIIMSGMVIAIIMSKFKREILALQGLQSSSHGSKNNNSTALASVVIGISTMRNRPLKTFLTAFTIVLLTFTILVFASFGSKIGVNVTYVGQNNSPERIEVRRDAYMALPEQIQETMKSFYGKDYSIINRGAYYPYPYDGKMEKRECVLYLPKKQESFIMKAALGLDQRERQFNEEVDAVYPDSSEDDKVHYAHPMYLNANMSSIMGVEIGDEIILNGHKFQYAGNFNRERIKSITYLDDMKLIPPDFEATKGEDKDLASSSGQSFGELLAQIDTSSFRWTPADSLILINYADLKHIRGFNNGMVLYPTNEVDIGEDAFNIAEFFEAPVYAKDSGGIKQYFYTESFDSSGVSDIIVPLLLGGLIIFSSLLGSIVDREREIFTFSALGLAPPNVAALFFAESSVYAVIGGLGGYIISQLVAVFLAYLSDIGVFDAPEMNFSSLSSTYTILLVMATVILSTIYPAIKAGKSANPGVARKWKMPAPDGDNLSFVFPFTVGSHDLGGILLFIAEHFDNHRDASLGNFAASNIEVKPLDDINYRLSATISLAPFDLGIFQEFSLHSQPSDIEGILEIVVELKRISGSPSSWVRNNRNFIDDLRNQFLLWRSLPAETVAHYISESRERGEAAQETNDD